MSADKSSAIRRRFALLGATGNTGRLILKRFLQANNIGDFEIHVYVRSRAKLEKIFPSLASDRRVIIFAGSLQDEDLFHRCLSGVETIICTLGENENIPGISVLQDSAQVIVSVLSSLRQDAVANWSRPRLILLSSSTWNERFAAAQPRIVRWMIKNAFARPYHDLVQAQKIFQNEPSLISLSLIQPSALMLEPASGCIVSTEFVHLAVSYEDLAEGFVQVATLSEYENVAAVGVSSQRAANPLLYIPFIIGRVVRGLIMQFVPGYWQTEYAISRYISERGAKPKII